MKSDKQQAMAAADFAQRWAGRGYEKGDSQVFWTELLTEVFGVENPSNFIRYEEQIAQALLDARALTMPVFQQEIKGYLSLGYDPPSPVGTLFPSFSVAPVWWCACGV